MGDAEVPIREKVSTMVSLPDKQRAAVREGTGASATTLIKQLNVPEPGTGEILVKINWSVPFDT